MNHTWPKRNKADNPDYPGEPLFKLEECAARLGVEPARFHALHSHNPGLKAWQERRGGRFSGHYNLYRLSDAKRWWAALPEEKRN